MESMDIIFSTSIIVAFLSGLVALFAPCCITILLPTYLASVFKNRKSILRMTMVFFVGMSVILVPIGLGAAVLADFFKSFHKEMYVLGGLSMLILAGLVVSGKGLSLMPMPGRDKLNIKAGGYKSVFFLGLFSGAATSCCAPVLAGAVTLAIISAGFFKALLVVFAYVLGITFPLFLGAYFYDRFELENSRIIQGKLITFRIGKGLYKLHSTSVVAGVVFFIVGIVLLWLAFSDNVFWAPSLQVSVGLFLDKLSKNLLPTLTAIPEIVWGILIFGTFIYFIIALKKNN